MQDSFIVFIRVHYWHRDIYQNQLWTTHFKNWNTGDKDYVYFVKPKTSKFLFKIGHLNGLYRVYFFRILIFIVFDYNKIRKILLFINSGYEVQGIVRTLRNSPFFESVPRLYIKGACFGYAFLKILTLP